MKLIFSVFDRATQAFAAPFECPHVGIAKRSFSDAINGKEISDLSKHPGDFELHHTAIMDPSTGLFKNKDVGFTLVCTGTEVNQDNDDVPL